MKIEIRETKVPGLVQITTLDERWYQRQSDKRLFPSVTWITSCYPKSFGFYKWLATKGWDEAEAIKVAAGNKGSKVHRAIQALLTGETVRMDATFYSELSKTDEELTVEEWECIMSFAAWWLAELPILLMSEQVVYNEAAGYAGTLDLYVNVGGKDTLIDIKTGQDVWPEHELQVTAYAHCFDSPPATGILQVGYRKNKKGYKFTETTDKWSLFNAAMEIWRNENDGVAPKQKDYPVELSIPLIKTKEG